MGRLEDSSLNRSTICGETSNGLANQKWIFNSSIKQKENERLGYEAHTFMNMKRLAK